MPIRPQSPKPEMPRPPAAMPEVETPREGPDAGHPAEEPEVNPGRHPSE